jgi:hypothetical protein
MTLDDVVRTWGLRGYTFMRRGDDNRVLRLCEDTDIVYADFPSHIAVLTVEDVLSDKWYCGDYVGGDRCKED